MPWQRDIAAYLEAATSAHATFVAAFKQFHKAAARHDFAAAELARVTSVVAMEAYLDHTMSQHRRVHGALK